MATKERERGNYKLYCGGPTPPPFPPTRHLRCSPSILNLRNNQPGCLTHLVHVFTRDSEMRYWKCIILFPICPTLFKGGGSLQFFFCICLAICKFYLLILHHLIPIPFHSLSFHHRNPPSVGYPWATCICLMTRLMPCLRLCLASVSEFLSYASSRVHVCL